MNPTRLLMTSSALMLGGLGLAGVFAPDLLLRWLGAPASRPVLLVGQVLGALYTGFAALNWMARDNLIGGIYSRPVAIGNLTHFLVAGLALFRMLPGAPELAGLWPLAVGYALFAAGFGVVLFRHPVRGAESAEGSAALS